MDLIVQPATSKKLPGLLRSESCFYVSKNKLLKTSFQTEQLSSSWDRMKGIPNTHPKGQPLLGLPSAWRPFRDFLCCDHPTHMQIHTMLSASRSITFFTPSCPWVAFVPPFMSHNFSVFTVPTLPCETHPALGELPFPANSTSTSSVPAQGMAQMTKKFPFYLGNFIHFILYP